MENKLFEGKKSEQYNALMSSFEALAEIEEMSIYEWLEKTPKTTMVVEIIDELNRAGFEIKEIKPNNPIG